jgi:hypothetical protein
MVEEALDLFMFESEVWFSFYEVFVPCLEREEPGAGIWDGVGAIRAIGSA